MFRNNAAPLTFSAILLAACGGGGDSGPSASEPPITQMPPAGDPPPDPVNISVAMSPPPTSEVPKEIANLDSQTAAKIYENMPWTRTVTATDGNGQRVALSLRDSGNGDAEAFSFDSNSGEFSVRVPHDYERPQDADGDNLFDLALVAHELEGSPAIPFKIGIADRKEIFEDYPVVRLTGETKFGGLGRNIVPLGDVDNDGRPDLAIAAPGRHLRDRYAELPPAGYHPAGEFYIVSGQALGDNTLLDLEQAESAGIWHLAGTENDKNIGYNMTLVGDLDDDGQDDFVIARDESTIDVISGATLLERMASGGSSALDELTTGTITLSEDQVIGARTFAALGDLDGDGLADLALCASEYLGGSNIEAQVFAVSGAALKEVLLSGRTQPISHFYDQQEAAYYAYSGSHGNCGPLTALGDVNDDGLMDVAIPVPGPLAGDSGAMVFGGAELLELMQAGGRHKLSTIDIFYGAEEPFTRFTDADVLGTEQDYVVTPLGDVTGDQVADFGFSWIRYQNVDDSAYIIKGGDSLLSADGAIKDIRAMVTSGEAIQLAATPNGLIENAYRVEPIHGLLAPENGLHSTLIFVGAGESAGSSFNSFSIAADELPDGGTLIASLPIAGTGALSIPKAYGRLLSYVSSVGDLNTDGYGDLAIGWGTAGTGPSEDIGVVLLVSGKEIFAARDRGETFVPKDWLAPQD